MKNRLIQTIGASALILGSITGAHAADLDNEKIHALLKNYEQAVPTENLVHAPLPLPVGSAAIDRPVIATGDRQLG